MNTLSSSQETRLARQKACEGCEFYKPETKSCGTFLPNKLLKLQGGDLVELEGRERKVRLCGCYLPAKWTWGFTECPLPAEHKRWGKELSKEKIKAIKELLKGEEPTAKWMGEMFEVYNSSFNHKEPVKSKTCGSCIQRMVKQLKEAIEVYS